MAFFAFLALSLLTHQRVDRDRKVTFDANALPGPQCIAELAKTTGQPLAAAEAIGNDYLVISVRDVPLGEVLEKVAASVCGKWVEDGGKLTLTTDEKREEETLRRRDKELVALLGDKSGHGFDQAADADSGLSIRDLVATLGPSELAGVLARLTHLVTYSNHPNPSQRQMPDDLVERLVQAAKKVPSDNADGRPMAAPYKVDLVLSPDGYLDLGAEVVLLDETGKQIRDFTFYMPSGDRLPQHIPAPNEKLTASDFAKAVRSLLLARTGRYDFDSKALLTGIALMLRPDLNEPLTIPGDYLIQCAHLAHLQLVADLTDEMGLMLTANSGFASAQTANQYLNLEALNGPLSDSQAFIDPQDGWLVVTPVPDEDAKTRFDRRELRRYLDEAKNGLSLDSVANFVASVHPYGGFETSWLGWLFPRVIFNHGDEPFLRLYGSLSTSQKASLKAGERVPLANLIRENPKLLSEILDSPNLGSPTVADSTTNGKSVTPTDFRATQSEAMPNGFPQDAYLVAESMSTNGYRLPLATASKAAEVWPPFKEEPSFSEDIFVSIAAYRIAHPRLPATNSVIRTAREALKIRLYIRPDTYFEGQIFSETFPNGRQAVDFEDLPSELKDRIQKQVKLIQSQPEDAGDPIKP